MDILAIFKALIGAITAALMALTGAPAQHVDAILSVATTTDKAVQETIQQATSTTKEAVVQAYELGKAMGRLQQEVETIKSETTTTTMTQTPQEAASSASMQTPNTIPIADAPPAAAPSLAHIDVVSPIGGKGLGRVYHANDYKLNPDGSIADGSVAPDDSNSIYIALVIYGDDGRPTTANDVAVKIENKLGTENRQLFEGNNVTLYPDGQEIQARSYPLSYEFRVDGTHIFTFSANGMYQTVTLNVQAKE